GEKVAHATTPREAVEIFVRELVESRNAGKVIEAVRELTARREPVTKRTLKRELERLGVEGLATGTTDHTTLKNWMSVAGIFRGSKANPEIDDGLTKRLLGISSSEQDEFSMLTLPQQIFLQALRRRHEVDTGPFLVREMLNECLATHPHLFIEDQFARLVRIPLEQAAWISVDRLAKGPQGGKSGMVVGSAKLLAIPVARIVPNF